MNATTLPAELSELRELVGTLQAALELSRQENSLLRQKIDALVPSSLHDALARFQMGGLVVVDFPEAWRQNIVEVLADGHQAHGHQAHGHSWDDHHLGSRLLVGSRDEWPGSRQLDLPVWVRTEQALRELTNRFAASSLAEEDLVAALQTAAEDPASSLILDACLKHAVSPDELLGELQIYDPGF